MIVAFDECSIINSFAIPVPDAWKPAFGANIKTKNYSKLNNLLSTLYEKGQKPYRFVPSKINIVKQAQGLINGITVMPLVLLKEVKKSIEKFMDELTEWNTITRNNSFTHIKKLFEENEQELKKNSNIPEDEDCEIIAGYVSYDSKKQAKVLITNDEHFYGYKELIWDNFLVRVVEEWKADVTANILRR